MPPEFRVAVFRRQCTMGKNDDRKRSGRVWVINLQRQVFLARCIVQDNTLDRKHVVWARTRSVLTPRGPRPKQSSNYGYRFNPITFDTN